MRLFIGNTRSYVELPRPVSLSALTAAAFPTETPPGRVLCVRCGDHDARSRRSPGPGLYSVSTADDVAFLLEGDTVSAFTRGSKELACLVGPLSSVAVLMVPNVVDRRDADVPPSRAPVVPFRLISAAFSSDPTKAPGVKATDVEAARAELRPLLEAAKPHRHFYIDLDGSDEERAVFAAIERCHDLSRRYFDLAPSVKEGILMDMKTRTWGHHVMGWKRKEVLKLRDVPDARARFPSVPGGPTFTDFQRCMKAFASVGTPALEALCWLCEIPMDRNTFFSQAPFEEEDDFAASFLETFRYAPFDDIAGPPGPASTTQRSAAPHKAALQESPLRSGDTQKAGVPFELHQDPSALTLSLASDGQGGGLQIYSVAQDGWVDVEAPMCRCDSRTDAKTRRPRVLVFGGDCLDYMARSRFRPAPHRVVMPPTATAPRYSTVFELMPHPQVVVPKAPVYDSEPELYPPPRARDLYKINTGGKSWH